MTRLLRAAVALVLPTALLAALLVAATGPVEAARPGTLTAAGCIGDTEGDVLTASSCAVGYEHLHGTGVPVISKDGKTLYVTAYQDHAVVWFDRDAAGRLSAAGCIADAPAPDGCVETTVLNSPWGLVASPDGEQLYVAVGGEGAITRLDIAADGSLSDGGCVGAPGSTCAVEVAALAGAYDVTISPDGRTVYAAAYAEVGGALVTLDRATDGSLGGASCLGGASGCAATPGMAELFQVVASPDGRTVYTASATGVLSTLTRHATTGDLTFARCVRDAQAAVSGCTTTAPALADLYSVAVAPDGTSLYAAANGDGAVTTFARGATGALTPSGCVADRGKVVGCSAVAEGLDQVAYVTVAPEGDQVLTASVGDNAVTTLNRSASGSLTFASCVEDLDDAGDVTCATSAEGLNGSFAVTVSPNGRSVHVGGYSDSALTTLRRRIAAPGLALAAAGRQQVGRLRATVSCTASCRYTLSGTGTASYRNAKGKRVTLRFGVETRAVTMRPAAPSALRLSVTKASQVRSVLKRKRSSVKVVLVGTAVNSGGQAVARRTVRLR